MDSHGGILWAKLILLLVVAIALVIGMVVMFVRGSRTTRWVGAVSVILFLLIAPVMLYLSMAHTQQQVTVAQQQAMEIRHRQAAIAASQSSGGQAWRHASEHYVRADHYPSAAAAARGLVLEIEPLLETAVPAGGKLHHVEFTTTERVDRSVAEAAAQLLAIRNPELYVSTDPAAARASQQPGAPPSVRVELDMRGSYTLLNEVDTFEGAFLEAQVSGPGGSFTRSAAVVPKPWVDDFNAFVSRKGGGYILAQSTEPALNPNEAQVLAMSDAAQQLTVHGQGRILATARHGSINATQLHAQILASLHDGQFIEDRFVQAFERPGGKVYQAWLLIRPDEQVLQQMAAAQFTAAEHHRQRFTSSIWGGVIMLIVVVAIYAFLNFVTRGYYATGLKLAGGAAVVLGLVLLLLLA